MNRFAFFIALVLLNINLLAQNKLSGVIIDEHTHEKLIGANIIVMGTTIGTSTNTKGEFTLSNIPDGKQSIKFSHIGYSDYVIELDFPYTGNALEIELESETEEVEEIFVNATRSSRTIDAEPTRVEVIAGEEIDEKISMDPSNISMILNESTGIQVQQTSIASANNVFRIQGLDGKYTQLLRDGFPLFGGFSGSLSLVQVPPLDLSQVEIIKGSSSTLYGGGAIAGLINLITKEPDEKGELSFLINGTSAMGLDLSSFYSKKFEKFGLTFLAVRNSQKAYDNNDDNFSDLPQIERYSLNPKFYFYFDERNVLEVGGSFSYEDRIGGFITAIENEENRNSFYHEENKSSRITSQIKYDRKGNDSRLTLKNSISYFKRELNLSDYSFNGIQLSTFSEAVYNFNLNEFGDWLLGVNLYTENFSDKTKMQYNHNSSDITYGSFVQNNLELFDKLSLETGLRVDYNTEYGIFPLPRVNLLIDISEKLKTRIGGGLGYKIPTIFTEASDELAYRNILPLDKENTEAEKSYGLNIDFDYKTILFGGITFSINNLFFYTRIDNPLYLQFNNANNSFEYLSLDGYADTKGIETNLKLTYDHYKLFAGYTFTDVISHSNKTSSSFPLTPKHNLGVVLIYEIHGDLRIGLEAYYTGKQKLSDGTTTTDYWINGIMIEKRFGKLSFFLNFENFLDTRQSNYGPMFTGTPQLPDFLELYAPTDGRIINGGVKIRL
ncbi:MAG: TonB-dependent receptor [Melioribacteraceae bacterium]|nr:TonB-dependent receptor [Melioribacteraceae bacterium]